MKTTSGFRTFFEQFLSAAAFACVPLAELASQVNLIKLSAADQVILVILFLLSGDALVARMNILQRIERGVYSLLGVAKPSASALFKTNFNPFDEPSLQYAKTLDVSGVSFHYLANLKLEFMRELLHRGCKVRLLGMSPLAPGVAHPKPESVAGNIVQATQDLSSLMHEGNLEIRQYDYSPPFGLVIVDGKEGFLVVSIYPYRTEGAKRPQIVLKSEDNDPWQTFYIEQFDKMWNDAAVEPVMNFSTDVSTDVASSS